MLHKILARILTAIQTDVCGPGSHVFHRLVLRVVHTTGASVPNMQRVFVIDATQSASPWHESQEFDSNYLLFPGAIEGGDLQGTLEGWLPEQVY
jgi:hypothetical protein